MELSREALERHLERKEYAEFLLQIWDNLSAVAPFAFRTLDEIGRYVDAAKQMDVGWEVALDEQLLHKVLPRIRGGDSRVGQALGLLLLLTHDRFPLTHAKLETMLEGYKQHGFASYF